MILQTFHSKKNTKNKNKLVLGLNTKIKTDGAKNPKKILTNVFDKLLVYYWSGRIIPVFPCVFYTGCKILIVCRSARYIGAILCSTAAVLFNLSADRIPIEPDRERDRVSCPTAFGRSPHPDR